MSERRVRCRYVPMYGIFVGAGAAIIAALRLGLGLHAGANGVRHGELFMMIGIAWVSAQRMCLCV